MKRFWIFMCTLAAVLSGCGGGANPDPPIVINPSGGGSSGGNSGGSDGGDGGGDGGGQTTPATSADAFQIGAVLPAWQEGYLDIHSINGGRGEAFYYILPDGTTILCDAAGAPPAELYSYSNGKQGLPSKPSVAVGSGTVIAHYIQHFAPAVSGGRIDYFLTSHYHGDHIGSWRDEYNKFGWTAYDKDGKAVSSVNLAGGGWCKNGLAEVGMIVPISKVIDRGDWSDRPSADYFTDGGKKRYLLYTNFLAWSKTKYGTVRETVRVGHTDQIVLLHDPARYSTFQVRNIAAGGNIWTGTGTQVNTTYMPTTEELTKNYAEYNIDENIYSCVYLLSYGAFDFFTGGDAQYTGDGTYAWKNVEKPIAKVVKKVEVMKACHHSTANTNSSTLLNVLKPDTYIAGVWRDVQPNPATLKRVKSANPNVRIFTTNLAASNVVTLSSEGIDPTSFGCTGGHVVVRVAPGGGKYWVLVLDDSNEKYLVTKQYGPYTSY